MQNRAFVAVVQIVLSLVGHSSPHLLKGFETFRCAYGMAKWGARAFGIRFGKSSESCRSWVLRPVCHWFYCLWSYWEDKVAKP